MSNSGLLVSLFLVSVASACFSATQPATRAYAVYAGVKQLVKREAKREIQIYKQSLPSKVFALYLNVWQGAELRTAVGRLKVQIVKHQLALSNISAQDEFARWAKTRRVLDKLKSEWETKASALAMVETAFNLTYNMFVRVLVYASHAYLFWAYRTQALFYLPEGWIGGSTTLLGWIVQSIVALPLAPVGGVGILFWLWCCNQITSRMLS